MDTTVIKKTLVVYGTSQYNPFMALARDVLKRYHIDFTEINVDNNPAAEKQLQSLVGQVNVPTLVVTQMGRTEPLEPPYPLQGGLSVRGVDRGTVITAPNNKELENWLHKHGFLPKPYRR